MWPDSVHVAEKKGVLKKRVCAELKRSMILAEKDTFFVDKGTFCYQSPILLKKKLLTFFFVEKRIISVKKKGFYLHPVTIFV